MFSHLLMGFQNNVEHLPALHTLLLISKASKLQSFAKLSVPTLLASSTTAQIPDDHTKHKTRKASNNDPTQQKKM